jgi:hypothetical protein
MYFNYHFGVISIVMYPSKESLLKQPEAGCLRCFLSGKIPVWFIWCLTLLLLIFSGVIYRVFASKIINTSISLPVPLNNFPAVIGSWTGTDMSIPTTTREYMEQNFADEYISRRYINETSKEWADVYIVYCSSRPGGMLGHQPRVCYPGNGWIHDSTEASDFLTNQDKKVNCLIHRFHKPQPSYAEITILNFYVVNGNISTNQSGFSGFSGRKFNFSRNPARYVAQIQISSLTEKSIRTAAKDMAELILDFLPNENGGVAALDTYGQY